MNKFLTVDTTTLSGIGRSLRQVAHEFDTADARSADVALHVGHEELADRLVRFANEWDGRRASLVEAIAHLGDACTAISQTFEELDSALAAALRGES